MGDPPAIRSPRTYSELASLRLQESEGPTAFTIEGDQRAGSGALQDLGGGGLPPGWAG